MKKLILFFVLLISSSSFADILKSKDVENDCSLYAVAPRDANGEIIFSPGQKIVSKSNLYGFSFENMEVDFQNDVVRVEMIQNIVFGFDKPFFDHKLSISPENEKFTFLINQLNRSIMLFEKVCVDSNDNIIYAEFFENKQVE
jgi:hypothetical protein